MEEWWFDEELAGCRLGVGRSDRRLRQLVERMEVGFGESIPLACQEWAGTKAAYRFFSNERVSEEEILRGHFDATRHRLAASDGPTVASSPGRSGSRPAGSGAQAPAHRPLAGAAAAPLLPVLLVLVRLALAVVVEGLLSRLALFLRPGVVDRRLEAALMRGIIANSHIFCLHPASKIPIL